MRKLILALTFCGFLVSCEKVDKLTRFTINDSFETTIPSAITMVPTDIPTPPVSSVADRELTMNNSRIDMIETVKLQELMMVITEPTGRRFDFLNDIEIYISADGLPEKKIASLHDIPETVSNTIRLTTENTGLEEYLKRGTYNMRVKVTTDKVLNENIKVISTAKYFIDAKVLGV